MLPIVCEIVAKGKMESLAIVDGYKVCGKTDITHMIVCPECGVEDSFLCTDHASNILKVIESIQGLNNAGKAGKVIGKLFDPFFKYRFTKCGHKGTLASPISIQFVS